MENFGRTLPINRVLRMLNSLDSSALLFAISDATNISSFVSVLNTVSALSSLQNGFQTTAEKLSTFASTQLDISTDTQRTNTSENLSGIWKVTSPSTVSTEYEKTVGKSIEFVHTYPRWTVIYLAKVARSL